MPNAAKNPPKLKTPIDGIKIPKPPPKNKDIALPADLALLRVTPKSLRKGTYQEKILAFFAQYLAPELLNSLRRGLTADNPQAQKLVAEMLHFIVGGKAPMVTVNQTNQTANINREAAEEGRKARNFEDIVRSVHEARGRRQILPAATVAEAEFVATPED